MNAAEIREKIWRLTDDLVGQALPYLSGRNVFTPEEVEDERIRGQRQDGDLTIPRSSVDLYAQHLASGRPVHVDTVFGASSSHRSALEALVAHLPNAGYLPADRRAGRRNKLVIWFPEEIHPIGELFDATNLWTNQLTLSSNASLAIRNETLSRALLTKPFLILTGLPEQEKREARFVWLNRFAERVRIAWWLSVRIGRTIGMYWAI